jgi:GNAT superfamily N-acetyltransferase
VTHESLAPLPEGYRVELFAEQEAVDADALMAFWADQGAMGAHEAARRVHEVLMVGVGPEGQPVGVATAYLQLSRQLRMTFWYSRVFVAADHRMGNLAFRLLLAARDHTRDRHLSGEDTRAAGIVVEVQNRGLRGHLVNATWRSDFTFVGQNDGGDHMRVHYFPGALAPSP